MGSSQRDRDLTSTDAFTPETFTPVTFNDA